MLELAPVPFLAPKRALAIAIMSYNGNVVIGLMGDYDAMADLDDFGEFVRESLEELLEEARRQKPEGARSRTAAKRSKPKVVKS